jgi:hypothetical protein
MRKSFSKASFMCFSIVMAMAIVVTVAFPPTADGSIHEASAESSAIPTEVIGADPFDAAPLADEACMEQLRQCCCCPSWTHYAIFDVLFLQRNNQIGDRPLVFDADTGLPVMSTQDLQPGLGTGMRLFYGSLLTDRYGWEVGYTGIYGMFGEAVVNGPDNLELPPPLGLAVNNFNGAEQVRATYWSTLNIAEANVFCYDCCEECGPDWCGLTRCKRNCHCINWLAGFVWAGLDESANLNVLCCTPPCGRAPTTSAAKSACGAAASGGGGRWKAGGRRLCAAPRPLSRPTRSWARSPASSGMPSQPALVAWVSSAA